MFDVMIIDHASILKLWQSPSSKYSF